MAGQQTKPITPLGGVKAFDCRSCGGQVQLRAPGQTLCAACQHCGAIADLTDPNFKLISDYEQARPLDPVIPIGRRGVLEGITWEVIGVMLRQAEGYDYFWEEYLLFNPIQGFRFLLNNQGHWTLLKMLIEHPQVSGGQLVHEGRGFKKFGTGNAVVAAVMGEFYWRVHYGDVSQTADYIAPPQMMSVEVEDSGMVWSKGEYLEPSVVKEAFKLEQDMPQRWRVAMNQPNPYKKASRLLTITAIIAMLLAFVAQFTFYGSAGDQVVYSTEIIRKVPNDTFVSPVFVIPGNSGNVEVAARANQLQNSWLEMDGYLHNVETLENYGVDVGFEYWSGVDDGESWSEGNNSGWHFHNLVPGGRYELVLSIAGDTMVPAYIEVRRNVPFFSNLWVLLGFIVIIPGIFFYLSRNFETRRWAESE